MPTYEYACKKCGKHTEVVQSFTDAPLTRCPECKGALRKVFGNVGITFKGSGFYKNDSRSTSSSTSSSSSEKSSSEKSSEKSGSDSSSAGSSSTATKTESAKTGTGSATS